MYNKNFEMLSENNETDEKIKIKEKLTKVDYEIDNTLEEKDEENITTH